MLGLLVSACDIVGDLDVDQLIDQVVGEDGDLLDGLDTDGDQDPFGAAEADEPEQDPSAGPDEAATSRSDDGRLICAYDGVPSGQPMDEDAYMSRIGEVNFALEQIVMDMDAELTELEQGMHDWRSLLDALEEIAHRYAEVTVGVFEIVPPDGAEDWHDGVMSSWVGVCEAINDGMAGTEDGDDERFEAFADALREFPSLMNDLHANTMVGPFEQG